MARQCRHDRLRRFNRGCCPVHGIFMYQIDVWYCPRLDAVGDDHWTRVGCPRDDCDITARAYAYDGPWDAEFDWDDLPDGWPDGGAVHLQERRKGS